MRLAFAGTPDFARLALARLHAAGFEIALVLSQPDRPAGRGMKVLAPVDVTPDANLYIEQYVAYHFMNAPLVAGNVTLTAVNMMKF